MTQPSIAVGVSDVISVGVASKNNENKDKSISINCHFNLTDSILFNELCVWVSVFRLNRRIRMLALIKDQSFIRDMLLWQQKTIPVLHWAVCDSVYKNDHSFTQHCPAINEKHARPWSLHLCDNNDFCSPLIISFWRCVSGCKKSWLASLSRIGQEETHRNTAPQGRINTTSTSLLNAQKEFWLSESKALRSTSSFRKCYKTFRM